jgi:hypothetical protein
MSISPQAALLGPSINLSRCVARSIVNALLIRIGFVVPRQTRHNLEQVCIQVLDQHLSYNTPVPIPLVVFDRNRLVKDQLAQVIA